MTKRNPSIIDDKKLKSDENFVENINNLNSVNQSDVTKNINSVTSSEETFTLVSKTMRNN